MQQTQEELKKRIEEVEVKIQETRDRLPAHSVKPPIMIELLDLEDEAHALRQRLETMKGMTP